MFLILFSKLWQKTKRFAIKYTTIFLTVFFLNQLLFFGLCLNPVCIAAAVPHVLLITVIIGFFWNSLSGQEKGSPSPIDIKSRDDSNLETHYPQIVEAPDDSKKFLNGAEHHGFLIKSIMQAQDKIIIFSGWLGENVIDEHFITLLSIKLNQGVQIYIGYGYQDVKGNYNERYGHQRVIKRLSKLAHRHSHQLLIAKFANHEKLLVIDELLVVTGSANWLSNRKYLNSERSIINENTKLARSEGQRAINIVKKYQTSFD